MQIHYLWVYDYGYLKAAGINLSSRFIFEMAEALSENNSTIYRLTVKNNPDYIPGFFEKDNVSNVTAIIGKNGAGKSSILKYIKSHLPEGLEAGVNNDVFAYSLSEDDETLYIIQPDHLEIEIDDQAGLFQNLRYGELEHSIRFEGHLSQADYIYYSYFLDFNEDLNDWHGLLNISTSRLLHAERRRIMEDKNSDAVKNQLLARASDLENLNLDEVARAIQFLGSNDSKKLPFERPRFLNIEINIFDSVYFFEGDKSDKDVNELLTELHRRNEWSGAKEGVLNNFLMAILINFYIDERKYGNNSPVRTMIPINEGESARDYILRFFKEIKNYTVYVEEKEVGISKNAALSHLVPEFLTFLDDLIERKIIKVQSDQPYAMILPLDDETEEVFNRFREYYLKVKGISTFFNFRWRSLSTGEQSYLSFMSRFYHVRHHEHNSNQLKSNLVILIDEGDACYHPEWQRKFFNTSLDFLSNLFHGHSIQLIFTANTPFLSSDLPKSNVLFIEKVGAQASIFHSKDNGREDTFAANIHTLYSNSFYLDGILIGEFARNRIDKIIQYLNQPDQKTPREDYKKTIEMIGEPVLRRKLQNMWAEKFGLDEELVLLYKRIQEINEIKRENKSKERGKRK